MKLIGLLTSSLLVGNNQVKSSDLEDRVGNENI